MNGVPTKPLFSYANAPWLIRIALAFCTPRYEWDGRYRITFREFRGERYVTAIWNMGGDE